MTLIESFLTRWYSVLATLSVLGVLVLVWIETSENYQKKVNGLYSNGLKTVGRVTEIIGTNANEANIFSWDIYYCYWDMDSLKQIGKNQRTGKRASLD